MKKNQKRKDDTSMCGAQGLSGHLNSIHPFFFCVILFILIDQPLFIRQIHCITHTAEPTSL